MRLRRRLSAVSDLAHIRDYIAANGPSGARDVLDRVLRSVAPLSRSGRVGQIDKLGAISESVTPKWVRYRSKHASIPDSDGEACVYFEAGHASISESAAPRQASIPDSGGEAGVHSEGG